MAAGIPGPPNQYPAGSAFDYSVWTPNTRIDLVNVNWDNTYRDVTRFADKAALNAFIDSRVSAGMTIQQLTYAKPGEDIYLGIPYNRVNRFNYLRASNPLMPIEGDMQKDFYYFILECEYITPTTTRIRLQLDVWQTYVYDVTFGKCYVERGHIGIANSNAFNNYGRDYLTVPEGLDVGGEYVVTNVRQRWVLSPTPYDGGIGSRYPSHDLLVFSTTDLLADPGTEENPKLTSADGDTFQGTVHGANVYIFDPQSFMAYLNSMKDSPWVTQGIVSITMIPKVTRYHPGYTYNPFPLPTAAPPLYPREVGHAMFVNWRDDSDFVQRIPERYRHLKKFWTYPYTVIQMTTFSGSSILIKPESWAHPHAEVKERANLVPPAQRIVFSPKHYNARPDVAAADGHEQLWPAPVSSGSYLADVEGDDYGDYLDMSTQISNLPQMAIVNDGAISYLAANQHAITQQFQGADWAQARALGMNQGSYDVATGAMSAQMSNVGSQMNADIAQTGNVNRTLAAQAAVNAISQGVQGVGQALTPGGFAGSAISGLAQGASTGINAAIQTASNDEALAFRNTSTAEQLITNNKQSQLVRDTNKSLSDWAARGDYAQQINALNAKVQDAQLIQPSQSGQTAGEAFNIVNGGLRVSCRWKTIDESTFRTVGEIWLRYGYAIRAFITPPANLMVMSKFTYWKLSETYISAATVPEGHKQVLRGIMEKGVTVWANPGDIGNIDLADNTALGGISY